MREIIDQLEIGIKAGVKDTLDSTFATVVMSKAKKRIEELEAIEKAARVVCFGASAFTLSDHEFAEAGRNLLALKKLLKTQGGEG